MPQILIGDITNHTHHLPVEEIHGIVEQWVLAHGGADEFGSVDNVHAAPAEDPKILKSAVRAWRDGPVPRVDFTQYVGHKMYWFGFCHGDPGEGGGGAGAGPSPT